MILLDSSVLIELFKSKDKEKTLFYTLLETENDFGISIVTHYELGIGSNEKQTAFWNEFLTSVTIFKFDTNCSIVAIDIYKQLKANSKLIDLADILIASTSVANQIPLATLNLKHFERIKGLEIVPNP